MPSTTPTFSRRKTTSSTVPTQKNPLYLTAALCDYIVVGWHSDMGDDPLGVVANPAAPEDLRSRLGRLFCAPPANSDGHDDKTTVDAANMAENDSGAATRLVCHAARYSVKFDADKPETPADDYAANFTQDRDMEPVAVGTTPLDAVLAFFQAHKNDATALEKDLFHDDNHQTVQTAQTLMEIQELLYATEDDYDSRVKAADLIFAHNFNRTTGGFTWHFDRKKDKDGPPAEPSPIPDPKTKLSEVDYVSRLNECQQAWDAADRKLNQLRWALFSEFFKFVSDPSNENGDRVTIFTSRIPRLRTEALALQAQQKKLQETMDGIAGTSQQVARLPVKKVANDPFFSRADPTLCLAGIDAGWDPDFLGGSTPTRFVRQLAPAGTGTDASLVRGVLDLVKDEARVIAGQSSSNSGAAPHRGCRRLPGQPRPARTQAVDGAAVRTPVRRVGGHLLPHSRRPVGCRTFPERHSTPATTSMLRT